MNDIFKDMQANVGCEYISDLPSYKRKVWQEMKRLNPADYEEKINKTTENILKRDAERVEKLCELAEKLEPGKKLTTQDL